MEPGAFQRLGETVVAFCAQVGEVATLSVQAMRAIFRHRWDMPEILRQCHLIGNRSIGIVSLTGIFTGMVMSLQFLVGLSRFGLKLYTGQIVGLSLARELGPVLASLMVAARVGAGITAEIASMVVTEQVQAIQAMGANPIQKLVAPRLIATMAMVPILTVFAETLGVLGGMVITMMEAGVTAGFFMQQIWRTVSVGDFLHGVFKTWVFAFCIVMISCHQALTTEGGTHGVGRSTTRAVVYSSIVIFIADFFLTKLLIIL